MGKDHSGSVCKPEELFTMIVQTSPTVSPNSGPSKSVQQQIYLL